MKSTRKILVALLLVLTMMVGLVSVTASAEEEGTTIYFQNNWLWTDVRCYCFSGENVVGEAFPGDSMTKVGTDADNYDVYSYVVPAGVTGVIISGIKNDGSGSRDQTPDITSGITEGAGWKMLWDGANNVESYTYNPDAEFVISSMTVAGSSEAIFGTAWDQTNTANDMTLNADGLYEKVYEGVAAGTYTFKCVANYNWGSCWGDPDSGDKDGNYIIVVEEADTILTITFNPETYEVKATAHKHSYTVVDTATCTEDGVKTSTCECNHVITEATSKTGHNYVDGVCLNCNEPEPAEHVHIFTWEITSPATCTADGVKTFSCTCGEDGYIETIPAIEHNYVYGVCSGCNAEDPNYVVDYYLVGWINDADCGIRTDKASLREDFKFVDGKVVVTFLSDSYVFVKTSDNQHWYMAGYYDPSAISAILYDTPIENVEDEGDGIGEKLFVPGGVEVEFSLYKDGSNLVLSYVAEEPVYTVAGSAGLCGTDWDVESFDNEMYIIEDGTYEIVYLGVEAGTYEFKIVKNNSWENGAWGADGGEANFQLVVAEDNSIVNINFNPVTKEINAQATAIPEVDSGDDPVDDPVVDPTDPDESGDDQLGDEPVQELNFFQKIWKAIVDFFMNLFASFKK